MKRIILLLGILLVGAMLFACAPKVVPAKETAPPETQRQLPQIKAKEAWEVEWEKTMAEAKKEGRVTVYSSLGSDQRIPLVDTFKKTFGFPLEFVAGRGEEMSAKISTERRAGLYLVDAYVGGATTIYTVYKSKGFLIPLKPEIILPDVKDPNIYWQNKLPFSDVEGKYVFSFSDTVSGGYVAINTSHIKKEGLSSYYDLLEPRFKGKIILQDPTTLGKGQSWFQPLMSLERLDVDYMKALAKQELFLTRDRRQQIESLARGKFWVSIANQSSTLKEFIDLGTPVSEVRLKEDVYKVDAGSGNVALMDKALHPWAAKTFANWLLTKEVQTIFARASDDESTRRDVPTDHLSPEDIRKPNVVYYKEDEKAALERPRYVQLAKELFGFLVK